jgi:hypothetical protein
VRSAPGAGTEVEFLIPEHEPASDLAADEGRP